jgi:predicted nucleic acid-binding protein
MPLNLVYKYISEVKDIIAFFPDVAFLNDAFEISMKLNHPIYDCLFLALAQNKGAAFASFDKR